jgi:alkanesulfonate monooxygenase SsuD/methylene tetrahydromethanopterin reductase-like flavin-dependent oxidoreductase (luciferase family)
MDLLTALGSASPEERARMLAELRKLTGGRSGAGEGSGGPPDEI